MPRKEQIVALVEIDTRDRLNILRLATGESRARVIDIALTGHGLGRLEENHMPELKRIQRLSDEAEVTPAAYALAYTQAFHGQTYPPDLGSLEYDDTEVRAYLHK